MNPEPLTQAFWDDLNTALLFLALLWLSIVAFAGSILVARALVSSLVYTGHLADRFERFRLPVYGLAIIAGLAVIAFAVLWISNLGVLYDIYDRAWY